MLRYVLPKEYEPYRSYLPDAVAKCKKRSKITYQDPYIYANKSSEKRVFDIVECAKALYFADNISNAFLDNRYKEAAVIEKSIGVDVGDKYFMNCDDVISVLINECGKWCSYNAVDLFYFWKDIETLLEKKTFPSMGYIGFHDDGVDTITAKIIQKIKYAKEKPYYNRVFGLKFTKKDTAIYLELKRVI